MNPDRPIKPDVVPHPGGGMTLAVPVGHGSTVRIYRGCFNPIRKKFRRRRVKP